MERRKRLKQVIQNLNKTLEIQANFILEKVRIKIIQECKTDIEKLILLYFYDKLKMKLEHTSMFKHEKLKFNINAEKLMLAYAVIKIINDYKNTSDYNQKYSLKGEQFLEHCFRSFNQLYNDGCIIKKDFLLKVCVGASNLYKNYKDDSNGSKRILQLMNEKLLTYYLDQYGEDDDIARNVIFHEYDEYDELLSMPVLERMKKFHISDYDEFCTDYYSFVTIKEAKELYLDGLISFKTLRNVFYYNYNHQVNMTLFKSIKGDDGSQDILYDKVV